MKRSKLLIQSFNWRMLLVRVVVNMLALVLTLALVPQIYLYDRTFVAWIVLALALGVLNALIKPLIQIIFLRFIFATTGLVVILINALILKMLSWIFPQQIAVSGIIWPLVGGAVLGLSASILESLLGVSPPIVSEKYPEIRQRVKDRQFYRTQAVLARAEARVKQSSEPPPLPSKVSHAAGSVAQYLAPAAFEGLHQEAGAAAAPEASGDTAATVTAEPVQPPATVESAAEENKVAAAKPATTATEG